MELRYIEDVKVIKSIVHVIDKSAESPIYSDVLMDSEIITEEFIPNHVTKVLSDFENSKARFYDHTVEKSVVRDAVKNIIFDEELFIEDSKVIAEKMFKCVKKIDAIQAFDLCISLVDLAGQRALAIMKMDYQMNYVHDVIYDEGQLKVVIVPQHIGLPTSKQRLSNSVIIIEPGMTTYDMMVMNKKERDEEGNLIDYFLEDFLEAEEYVDDTSKTVKFKKVVESWIRKNTKDDMQSAAETRETVNAAFVENAYMDVPDLLYKITNSNEERVDLEEKLETIGIQDADKFEIDKKWVEKRMKNKQIKTDTGILLKGEKEFFADKMRFEMIHNGDGTVNYIIKNVRNISER